MKNNNRLANHPVYIAGIALTLLGSSTIAAAATHDVKVMFDGSNCPVSVSAPNVTVQKSGRDKIRWTSYNQNGTEKLNIVYEIFFDPFKGKSLTSNNNGEVTSNPVDNGVPVNVEFKYTVYSPACPNKPLDPRIKVV